MTTAPTGSLVPIVLDIAPASLTLVRPVFFDFDDDGDMDLLFADDSSFYWYENRYFPAVKASA